MIIFVEHSLYKMSIFRFLFWHAFYSLRQKLWPFMLSKKREKSLGLLTFYSLCIDGMIKKWFIIAWWQEKGTKMRYFDRQVSNFDIYQLGILSSVNIFFKLTYPLAQFMPQIYAEFFSNLILWQLISLHSFDLKRPTVPLLKYLNLLNIH